MKTLEKQLDTLWAQAVKAKDHHKCVLCYGSGTDAHHLISRRNKTTRWLISNGICLCRNCHILVTEKRLELNIPEGLTIISKQIATFIDDDLQDIKKLLKEYIQRGI